MIEVLQALQIAKTENCIADGKPVFALILLHSIGSKRSWTDHEFKTARPEHEWS